MKLLNSNLQLSTLKLIKSQWAGFFNAFGFISHGSYLMYFNELGSIANDGSFMMFFNELGSFAHGSYLTYFNELGSFAHHGSFMMFFNELGSFLMVHIFYVLQWVGFICSSWFFHDVLQWVGFICSWFIFDVLQWVGFIAQGPQVLYTFFGGQKRGWC